MAAANLPNPELLPNFERFGRSNVTTSLERSMVAVQEKVVSTLFCPVCQKIFRLPVATCIIGHLTCSACVHGPCGNKCGICHGPITTNRNSVIEAQLALVPTFCPIPECNKVMRASEFHDHINKHCEFRPILCQYRLPNGDQCDEKIGFKEFFEHLINKHRCFNAGLNPALPDAPNAGYSACNFTTSGRSLEEIFRALPASDTSELLLLHLGQLEGIWPILVHQLDQTFLLTSYLRGTDTYFWVTAMLPEAEASKFTVTLRVPSRQNNQVTYHDYTNVRIHNFHTFREMFHQDPDVVFMPYHVFLDYTHCFLPARDLGYTYSWTVYVKIHKETPDVEIIDNLNAVPGDSRLLLEESVEVGVIIDLAEGDEDRLVPQVPDSTRALEDDDDDEDLMILEE